ncbi:MAG: hypothetical protein WED04_05640 [Promethearchaeati archaeon SRVP18_Atabeyarchaeia-1]
MADEIERLKAEAERYRSMKVKSAAAEKLFEASTRLRDKGEDAEAIRLLTQAIKLYEDEGSESVEGFLEKAAPVLDSLSQPKLAAETYLEAAKQHLHRKDHRGAIPVYLKAADAYRRANVFQEVAESLRAVAEEYRTLSEPLLAAEHVEKEASARLQINDARGASSALRDARDLYVGAGHFDEAARCLMKAAEVLVQAGNNREGDRILLQAAEDLQSAADESTRTGDHNQADHLLSEAAAIYEKAKQPAEASRCHARAAEEEVKKGDMSGAAEDFRKAAIDRLLAGDLEGARGIIDSVKNDEVRKTTAFKQSSTLLEIFEKGDEGRLNAMLKEINDFSWVRLCLAFGKLAR